MASSCRYSPMRQHSMEVTRILEQKSLPTATDDTMRQASLNFATELEAKLGSSPPPPPIPTQREPSNLPHPSAIRDVAEQQRMEDVEAYTVALERKLSSAPLRS